ncbi:MAG: SMI1/KNR4 family protein [Oscillospiraceae bacterium]|nr:SMI1/KNR4 family protein [Oscillospiraceae bacterium]
MKLSLQQLINAGVPMALNPAVTSQAIALFELQQRIQLPEYYREWLLFANGGELFVPGTQLYGIAPAAENSLVAQNSSTNRSPYALPNSLYIVGRTNFGDILCVDLNSQELVQWDHEENEEFLRWNSLVDYIDDELRSYSEGA